jgi:Rrf2 family nitric oxide-sensitive transcriptional repressor
MRLALLTDYALRTLIYLAGRSVRTNVHEVADFYRISPHHVAKVVHRLARLGYIRSIRGVGGGIEMVRSASDIRVGEVIRAFEGNLHLLECVGTPNVCVIQPSCRLKRVLAEAERLQTEFLDGVRLSDIVNPGGQLTDIVPVYVSNDPAGSRQPTSPTPSADRTA